MDILLLSLLGVVFLASYISYLAVNKRQRDIVLTRLHFHKRQTSGAQTPPRSLSPFKEKAPEDVPTATYEDVFPPSRRFVLANIETDLASKLGKPISDLVCSPPDSRTACAPLTTPLEQLSSTAYTPTEFTIEEIQALGDFPDYAGLSGVPLPEPYPTFDINKALPRPYRPLRWAYHQTMCESRNVSVSYQTR